MSTTNIPYSDNDSDNDDDLNNDQNQPLLQSSSATIKLPTSIVVLNKSNFAKTPTQNQNNTNNNTNNNSNSNGSNSNNFIENRFCTKLSHLLNVRFNRTEHNRRSHRDRWSRINIGLFTISFVSVIYLCVSLNLNVDSKPSPQMIVDVPPVDPDLVGTKGKILFNVNYMNAFIYREICR